MVLKLFDIKNSKDNKELNLKGVYQITCTANNKRYIGSTILSFIRRLIAHKSEMIHNIHHCYYMQNTFNKYGKDSFNFEIIEIIEDSNIIYEREQYYISNLKPELNSCLNVSQARKTYSNNNIIINRNNKSFTNIIYFERFKQYKAYIKIQNQEILLNSSIVKEDLINSIKKAEDYFWNSTFDSLNKKLKLEVIKQYKLTCKECKANSKIPGVYYSKYRQYCFSLKIINNTRTRIIQGVSFEEVLRIKQEAEGYFYSDCFINLSCEDKIKAIQKYRDNLLLYKPTKKNDKRNKSGHKFIVWDTNLNRWIIKLKVDNKLIILGSSYDINLALEIRNKAADYFTSGEFINNDVNIKKDLIKIYKKECHKLTRKANQLYLNKER